MFLWILDVLYLHTVLRHHLLIMMYLYVHRRNGVKASHQTPHNRKPWSKTNILHLQQSPLQCLACFHFGRSQNEQKGIVINLLLLNLWPSFIKKRFYTLYQSVILSLPLSFSLPPLDHLSAEYVYRSRCHVLARIYLNTYVIDCMLSRHIYIVYSTIRGVQQLS